MAEIALQSYRHLWDKGFSAEPFNKLLQHQMEDDENLCPLFELSQFVRSPTFSSCVLFWVWFTTLYGGITEPLSFRCLLTVISETSIFGSKIILCWLNTHMQLQKEKHVLKIIHFFLNMRKIRKQEPLFQWEKTYWRLHKNNPSTTAAELCSLQGGLGKAMASFQRKLELNSRVTLCVWPRSELRSLNHWGKWYKCLWLRLQQDEGGFANSPLLLWQGLPAPPSLVSILLFSCALLIQCVLNKPIERAEATRNSPEIQP